MERKKQILCLLGGFILGVAVTSTIWSVVILRQFARFGAPEEAVVQALQESDGEMQGAQTVENIDETARGILSMSLP